VVKARHARHNPRETENGLARRALRGAANTAGVNRCCANYENYHQMFGDSIYLFAL